MALTEQQKTTIETFVTAVSNKNVTDANRADVAAIASDYNRYTAKKFIEMFSQIKSTSVDLDGHTYTLTANGAEQLFDLLEESTALSAESKISNVVNNDGSKNVGSANDAATVIVGGEFNGAQSSTLVNGEEVTSYTKQTYKVLGQDIILNDSVIQNSAIVDFDATGKLVINNVTVDNSDGSLAKTSTSSNSVLKVSNGHCESIVLKQMKMKATDTAAGKNLYNGVEFWAGSTCKNILIEKCAFLGSYTHNAINIYSCANNAVITVKDCYFDNFNKDGNILRLSNINNATNVHIIFDNCVFDHWDGDSLEEGNTNAYAGFCLCQDYTSKTAEAEAANKLFGPDKIKITLKNCSGPVATYGNSRIIPAPTNVSSVCATGLKDQLCYVYGDVSGVFPYSADIYPEIIVIPGETNLPAGVIPSGN